MLKGGAFSWQEFVGINGETAVPSDEHSYLWLRQGAHQESNPSQAWRWGQYVLQNIDQLHGFTAQMMVIFTHNHFISYS